MMRWTRWPQLATLLVLALALGYLAWLGWGLLPGQQVDDRGFNGERALSWAQMQCELGPRPAGSEAAWQTGAAILAEMQRLGWRTSTETYATDSRQLRNIMALAGEDGPLLVLATHYDTRSVSELDADPERRQQPTPGANDGASGVATLLELARALDVERLSYRVLFLFLDGEADVGLADWPDSSGAAQFTQQHRAAAVIYLTMVGGADARFPRIPDATDVLQAQLWHLAAKLTDPDLFVDETGPELVDTHSVFLQAGIPTAEIIQPDYAYARTTEDTCDKLDAATLKATGVVLESYLENNDFMTILPALKARTKTP